MHFFHMFQVLGKELPECSGEFINAYCLSERFMRRHVFIQAYDGVVQGHAYFYFFCATWLHLGRKKTFFLILSEEFIKDDWIKHNIAIEQKHIPHNAPIACDKRKRIQCVCRAESGIEYKLKMYFWEMPLCIAFHFVVQVPNGDNDPADAVFPQSSQLVMEYVKCADRYKALRCVLGEGAQARSLSCRKNDGGSIRCCFCSTFHSHGAKRFGAA